MGWLESRDDAALANGANLAVVGSEVFQLGRAIATGPRRFRLEHLLRGRFGCEWATPSHGPSEKFVLIRPGALKEIPLPPSAIGTRISIRPFGLADDDAAPVECLVTGEALRPPPPVDLRAEIQVDGVLSIAWTRRSRLGWNWPGDEPPLGENSERYRVTVQGSAGTLTVQAQEPAVSVSSEHLGNITGTVTITVVQIGDFAESRPLTGTIEI